MHLPCEAYPPGLPAESSSAVACSPSRRQPRRSPAGSRAACDPAQMRSRPAAAALPASASQHSLVPAGRVQCGAVYGGSALLQAQSLDVLLVQGHATDMEVKRVIPSGTKASANGIDRQIGSSSRPNGDHQRLEFGALLSQV